MSEIIKNRSNKSPSLLWIWGRGVVFGIFWTLISIMSYNYYYYGYFVARGWLPFNLFPEKRILENKESGIIDLNGKFSKTETSFHNRNWYGIKEEEGKIRERIKNLAFVRENTKDGKLDHESIYGLQFEPKTVLEIDCKYSYPKEDLQSQLIMNSKGEGSSEPYMFYIRDDLLKKNISEDEFNDENYQKNNLVFSLDDIFPNAIAPKK